MIRREASNVSVDSDSVGAPHPGLTRNEFSTVESFGVVAGRVTFHPANAEDRSEEVLREPALAFAVYWLDLPNDEATTRLVELALRALGARFSDNLVTIDEAVFNAARIVKLYGTLTMKGDPTADRPRRRATLEYVSSELVPVGLDPLRVLAAMAPAGCTRATPTNGHRPSLRMDLPEVFRGRGLYLGPLRDGKHAVTCPWAAEHSGNSGPTETVLFEPREPAGPWGFDCKHCHCARRTIKDVFAAFEEGQLASMDARTPVAVEEARAPESYTYTYLHQEILKKTVMGGGRPPSRMKRGYPGPSAAHSDTSRSFGLANPEKTDEGASGTPHWCL